MRTLCPLHIAPEIRRLLALSCEAAITPSVTVRREILTLIKQMLELRHLLSAHTSLLSFRTITLATSPAPLTSTATSHMVATSILLDQLGTSRTILSAAFTEKLFEKLIHNIIILTDTLMATPSTVSTSHLLTMGAFDVVKSVFQVLRG